MKESYKEFKNECLSNKLQMIQSIENQLIEQAKNSKIGSESVLFTDWIFNTRVMLGIENPKNAEYEALKTDRAQKKLDEVLSYINEGYIIKDAITKAGMYGNAFYKTLNDKQATQLQAAKVNYRKKLNT